MEVSTSNLLEKLSLAKKTIGTDQVPQFQNFCFRNDALYSFDGLCGVAVKAKVGITGCIPAAHLLRVVGSLKDKVEVTQDETSGVVTIQNGRTQIRVPTAPVSNYPEILPRSFTPYLGPDSGLHEAMKIVVALTSDERQVKFAGVGIRGKYVYGTDGKRATRAKLAVDAGPLVTIPMRAAKRMLEWGEPRQVVVGKGQLVATYSEHLFVTALMSVNSPVTAIDNQIQAQGKRSKSVVVSESLREAVQRASVFANEKTSGVRFGNSLGKLTVSSGNRELGTFAESESWGFGEDFEIWVQPSHFLAASDLTSKMDLTNVIEGDARNLRFDGPNFTHILSLMVPLHQ